MRTTFLGRNSKVARTIPLVVFSVGGQPIAAKADEVGGIWPWTHAVPVPSGTPYVNAILRRGEEMLPVFDLAHKLQVQVQGPSRLCLIAKRHDGPMAVCIDGDIPTLQVLDPDSIVPTRSADADVVGTCRIGDREMPIYSLARLGLGP